MRARWSWFAMVLLGMVSLAWGNASGDLIRLFDSPSWNVVKTQHDGMVISNRPIIGSSVQAMMVSKVVSIPAKRIAAVIMNVDGYRSFISNADYMPVSRSVSHTGDTVIAYQCMSVPLISDRHCFSRIIQREWGIKPDSIRIDWVLIDKDASLEPFTKQRKASAKEPIYLNHGAGSWLLQSLDNGQTRVTYRCYTEMGGNLPDFVVNLAQRAGVTDFFKDVLRESERPEKGKR